jgi:hypothetical protein
MTVARSSVAESRYLAANKEDSAIAAHGKSQNAVADHDNLSPKFPHRGAQWPLVSHPSFSPQNTYSNSLEASASANMSVAALGSEYTAPDRLLSFGDYCSPDQNARIELWVKELIYHEDMEHTTAPKPITTELYKDWLHCSKDAAISWLRRLDKVERRFRIASLNYHSTPYMLRHSTTFCIVLELIK